MPHHCHMSDHELLHEILRSIMVLETNQRIMMTTQAEFDASLDALIAAEAARDAAVTQALNDLEAKIAAGGVQTPADFSAELAKVTALQTAAAAITATASADDPGPTTVTPPTS